MTNDDVRALGLVLEGRRSALIELYRIIESRTDVRVLSWQDAEPRSLEVRTKRPQGQTAIWEAPHR